MIKFWKRHSLSIVLFTITLGMFLSSWHLGKAAWDGKGSYFDFFVAQSIWAFEGDMFGGFILVLFTKWFKEYGSAASNDTKEEKAARASIDNLEDRP